MQRHRHRPADRERSAGFYGQHFGLTERIHDDEHLLIIKSRDGSLLALSEGPVPDGLGIEVARDRREIPFKSGNVLHVDVPLDVCQPHPTSGRFSAVAAPTGDALDAAALVPGANAASAGDVAVGLAAGRATRFSIVAGGAAQGVGALVGGAPDAPPKLNSMGFR